MARRAYALDTLVNQVNTMFPKRDKQSDGWIGDVRHQSKVSDHNPNSAGVVTAQDFDHDADDLDCEQFSDKLVTSRDSRIKYIIWNERIWYPASGWRAYSGSNPHTVHLHLSVSADPKLYDNATKWNLGGDVSTVADTEIDQMSWIYFGYGASQDFIKEHRGKESNTFERFMFNHPVTQARNKQIAEWRKKAETGTDAQAQRKLDEIKRIVG